MHLKGMFFLVFGWKVLKIFSKSKWSVSFKMTISLFIFCQDVSDMTEAT